MNISSNYQSILFLISCLVLWNTGCGQNQLDTSASQKVNGEKQQQISEGLVGRIETRNGEAVADAMILPTPGSSDTPPIPEIAITTDKEGRYEWPLQPGSYVISVYAEGFRKHTQSAEIKANSVTTLNFLLD